MEMMFIGFLDIKGDRQIPICRTGFTIRKGQVLVNPPLRPLTKGISGRKHMILSLQGCMAVGKTTAVRYLQENAPYVNISYEINTDIIDEVKQRQLNKNKYEDYLEIQKLWLKKEIVRYNKANGFICSIMDFGAEEIEFYTLNYPKTIGQEWEIENALHEELEQV